MKPVDLDLLVCPACHSSLTSSGGHGELVCANGACACHSSPFPKISGLHCLIDFDNSIIDRGSLTSRAGMSPVARRSETALVRFVRSLLQGVEPAAKANCQEFLRRVTANKQRARVLVIGGGTIGPGAGTLYTHPDVDIIAFDVYASPEIRFIADAHAIPLRDQSFDGVWIQAVLEHVLDPQRVTEEIWRVLAPRGIVYAETPFMQQVHEGAYDFIRFTHSGHRWLFRRFDELSSGLSGGVGTAILWSLRYLFRALFRSEAIAIALQLPFFWLRWLDRVADPMLSRNSASAMFFLGVKSDQQLRPSDMIAYYDQMQGPSAPGAAIGSPSRAARADTEVSFDKLRPLA